MSKFCSVIEKFRNNKNSHAITAFVSVKFQFGSRSKIQLDYWWAEATPPLPQPITITQKQKTTSEGDKTSPVERVSEKEKNGIDKKEKADKTPEKGTDSSVEDDKEKRESDTDIFSPKNTYSQDSNDGLSGDERKSKFLKFSINNLV